MDCSWGVCCKQGKGWCRSWKHGWACCRETRSMLSLCLEEGLYAYLESIGTMRDYHRHRCGFHNIPGCGDRLSTVAFCTKQPPDHCPS